MMSRGRIVEDGSPPELLRRFSRTTLEDVFLDIARGRVRSGAEAAPIPAAPVDGVLAGE
jgi:ABC-2 type transport system ATP-binding protein